MENSTSGCKQMHIFYRNSQTLNFSLHRYIISVLFIILFLPSSAVAYDTLQLARQIADSISKLPGRKYATVAFSNIQGNLDASAVSDIIDLTQNEIYDRRRFRIIDRSNLKRTLDEQKFNLTGMVSSETYKELGKLLSVDLFIFGRYYDDVMILKAIDVESSAIVWADIFELKALSKETRIIKNLAEETNKSILSDLARLKANRINQISFWNINSEFNSRKVVDYLLVTITQSGNFRVIDRENIQVILEEQKLNMEDFIDEQRAKRMGELYGVDAFIYGRVTKRQGFYLASLKMQNIYNGVIEWAKTIKFSDTTTLNTPKSNTRSTVKTQEKNEMILIPAGVFVMGSNKGREISFPAFKVPMKAYYIDKTEVSNREYEAYVKKFKRRKPRSWPGGNIPKGKEDDPVVMVNWNDATKYCRAMGKRLPKEVEWEKAFRGTQGAKYTWKGDKFFSGYARTIESGSLSPDKTNSQTKDISVYGVKHMAGNVREWVESFLRPYPGSPYRSSKIGRERVIRGGSWATPATNTVGWFRASSNPTYGWKDVGFRCARSFQ